MLHPVGDLPPAVYWRRRIFLLALPLFLLVVLLWALFGGGGGNPTTAASTRSPTSEPARSSQDSSSSSPVVSSSSGEASAGSSTRSTTTESTSASVSASKTAADRTCRKSDLTIEAATSSKSFSAGSRPILYLQVTNSSSEPCRHDLADKQIELRIRSGDARIWGSHDCQVQPGKDVVTLMPDTPVRRGIVWSGRTSAPGCQGTRLQVQAGTYNLYAYLSGARSKPVMFTVTS